MSDWTQAQDHWRRCRCIKIYTQHPIRTESERARRERIRLDQATDAGGRALIAYYCHPIDSRERP